MSFIVFEELFEIPLRNGLTKPKRIRGEGYKMVNMGELFAYPRINNLVMDRAPLNEKEKESSLLKTGDLLFARQSLVREGAGQCSIFLNDQEEVCFESHLIRCRLKQDIANPTFYFYFFSSCLGKKIINTIVEQGAGAAGIRGSDLAKLIVPKPSIVIQERIAKILSDLDDKIYLNNQINQTLESIAQAIFKSWFIDFDPVRAKIAAKQEGKDPERAAMCAISGKSEAELKQMAKEDFAELQATAALFPDELVESELGEVPKGWEVNSLGNICNFTPGSAFKPEYQGQTQGEIPFIKVSDMNLNGNESFIVKANNYIDNSLQKERKFKLHEEGATVFAKIGVALISNRRRLLTMPTIIDNNMMSASPVKALSTPYYLYLLLKTIDFNTLVSGTALPYLNVSDLRKISIVHPTINLLNKFELMANPLLQKIKLNSVQCEGMVTLRDNLLPKLLSGEIDASVLNGEHG